MKAVLMSIKPKYCELIASGKKTIEVRKTKPKIEAPFKVYIYCTKPRHYYKISRHLLTSDESLFLVNGKVKMCDGFGVEYEDREYKHLNCKVIGEFVCDSIVDYEAELRDDKTFERIQEFYEPDDFSEYGEYEYKTLATNEDDRWKENVLCKASCLTVEELRKYLGAGITVFHGWHISNLVIYDKPKELSGFCTIDNEAVEQCEHRERIYNNPDYTNGALLLGSYVCNKGEIDWCTKCKTKPITRPPQSWCYVEELR